MPYRIALPPISAANHSQGFAHGVSPIPQKPVRPVRTGEASAGPQVSYPVHDLRPPLRRWFAMTARVADGDVAALEEAQGLWAEINRLWAELGPAFAETVQRQEARTYYGETRRCPFCGERDIFHGPEPELQAALAQAEAEIHSGQIGAGPILVRGCPLADWLPLEEVARLLRGTVERRRSEDRP